ncbi:MAG: pyridoxamine 5'-phosphate oxidase family protein [Candidatus Pacebacteria bacterium]|jgi:general stress protein 26|nr:pyridoxamine 5'-phosphate oxidase family protein [Candidatus Paceibacterota bacterium]MBT4652476.1 pyridoxamine 5'-phosphate oxidase family protein [Candidatus Paceibacterota bacterium]MBT6756303.1 pyridoxamine 5'-phosphate oxidase family protein [Candidatus Paceibacterota bacterium]MBT6921594.1 pyridoxamine 5'-phosphate oxidase family protein [Candidatus Paceibacterota bacterium]
MPKTYSKQEILSFLQKTSLMSVALCQKDNKPLSTILLFALDDDFTLYFATISSSYKAKAIENNKNISFSVWKPEEMLVQANGVVDQITDQKAAEEVVDKIAEAAASLDDFWPPVLQIKGHDYSVYKVKINWLHALDLSSKNLVEKTSLFTEVELYDKT